MVPLDYKSPEGRRRRFRPIPVRMLVPNVITLLAICAGLTAIRLSTEGRMELAVYAIVFAAVLDGIDGRVARMIKGQSKFGAELDSLADFVNFGVAPGLMLYFWQLHELNNGGWIAAMVFAISGGLRLARFNATHRRSEQAALCRQLFHRRAGADGRDPGAAADLSRVSGHAETAGDADRGLYAPDRVPDGVAAAGVFRQDRCAMRVPPEMVLPVFVSVIFFIALLIGYPWHILSIGSVLYLASLPLGWKSYKDHERAAAAAAQAAPAADAHPCMVPRRPFSRAGGRSATEDERPERLH